MPSRSRGADWPPFNIDPIASAFDHGEMGYPYLVIRLVEGIYQYERVNLRDGPPSARIYADDCSFSYPGIDPRNAIEEASARTCFEAFVLDAARRAGFQFCIVWRGDDCTYVEPDGAKYGWDEPPSGLGAYIALTVRPSLLNDCANGLATLGYS